MKIPVFFIDLKAPFIAPENLSFLFLSPLLTSISPEELKLELLFVLLNDPPNDAPESDLVNDLLPLPLRNLAIYFYLSKK